MQQKERKDWVWHMNVFVHDMTLIYHRADATPAIPCGLVARISGSHPGGPGSIPGKGEMFAVFSNSINSNDCFLATCLH